MGQYQLYRFFLEEEYPGWQLFLAISSKTYQDFFRRPEIQAVCRQFNLDLLVFDAEQQEVIQWIS